MTVGRGQHVHIGAEVLGQRGGLEDLVRCARSSDATLVQEHEALGELARQCEIVHGADDRQPTFGTDFIDELQSVDATPEVKSAGRLVE